MRHPLDETPTPKIGEPAPKQKEPLPPEVKEPPAPPAPAARIQPPVELPPTRAPPVTAPPAVEPLESIASSRATIRTQDGREFPIHLGEQIGQPSAFNILFRDAENPGRAFRVAREPGTGLDPYEEFGRAGLQEVQGIEKDVRIVTRHDVYQIIESDNPLLNGRRVESVEFMAEGDARRLFEHENPIEGQMTLGQAAAVDRGQRAFNRHGYVHIDAKPDNYSLEWLENEGRYRMVVIDPGGLFKVNVGSPEQNAALARRIQAFMDDPTTEPSFAELVKGWDMSRGAYMRNKGWFLNDMLAEANIDLTPFPVSSVKRLPRSPLGNERFPRAREYAGMTEPEATAAYPPSGTR